MASPRDQSPQTMPPALTLVDVFMALSVTCECGCRSVAHGDAAGRHEAYDPQITPPAFTLVAAFMAASNLESHAPAHEQLSPAPAGEGCFDFCT